MARARALCTGTASGVENASFWSQQCEMAVRCLLHAAALGQRAPVELYRWSLSALAAEEAADILRSDPQAAPGWATALEAVLSADPRQRDSTWAMVANTFAALGDPSVLEAVSPRPGERFDPAGFLRLRGTLYLLGTASGASATANLVAAFIEDIVESARRLAAASPGARLDPPLAVILDEAANYPLPSLPSLMSDGGGTGITTFVVLQSLAQARARWGRDEAAAIWDAAIVKLILGGSGNADDLRDLTALVGTRKEQRASESWGPDLRRTVSTSAHEVPILDTGQLRTLPFGQAVLLLRSAPPILLRLRPWTARHDAVQLHAHRTEVEASLCQASPR
jgi:type IV secretory pathway TraG/TraD family ATPase VirD4